MSPSLMLETPVIESKPFLLRDSHLPMMMDEGSMFLKQVEDDDFSTDSWDKISNEELNDIVEITKGIMSPPASPGSNISVKSESFSDDQFDCNELLNASSPSDLIQMEGKTKMATTKDTLDKKGLNDVPEVQAVKRERNRLAARRCRQKQKDRIDYLERDVKEIETANYKVENEIRLLQKQLKDLQDALLHHDCRVKSDMTFYLKM